MYHKMLKVDQYCTDSIFQLEQNLHNIRRELILMIEEFEKQDCIVCMQLKCRCTVNSPKKDVSLNGKKGFVECKSNDGTPNKAPPADSLPTPKFQVEAGETLLKAEKNNFEAWIQASKAAQKAKHDRLSPKDLILLQKSGLSNKGIVLDDFKKEGITFDTRLAATNAVEVFFNSFKVQPAVAAANMSYVTNLAAVYGHRKSRSSEYTYF